MTDKEIIQALRCTSTPGSLHEDCTGCPYYRKEQLDAELKEKLGVDTWPSCDVNKVGMDAADLIERLTAENVILPDGQASAIESLRKEIEWKDMVIALAQRKQAEAEAERDALREKAPRWISVEARLPSPGARVLITDGVFVGEGFLVGKAFFGHGEGTSWKRYSNIPWNESMKTEITHWMPLPEAPEEGEKA